VEFARRDPGHRTIAAFFRAPARRLDAVEAIGTVITKNHVRAAGTAGLAA